ncbi:hypothetical protein GCM10023310_06750 [Paenibacillus vulneris]|uniref:Uncharacterized protein n=1 Tax=Paenibacillus vulneris TaxID=1133364 RepID=A0ABW3ULT0_9BACL
MEPIDDELKQGMAEGPLIRHGFSEALKKRIGERIDEQDRKKKKQWMPWSAGLCTALAAIAVFLSFHWYSPFKEHTPETAWNESPASKPAIPLWNTTIKADPVRSAVLIGLRKDHPASGGSPEYSTYRTLLLAEEQGELRKSAEGSGILMPYKTEFLRIVPQRLESAGSVYQKLSVAVATEKNVASVLEANPAQQQVRLSEKLLFAGNRYVSVSQTVQQDKGKDAPRDFVWVKDVEDLTKTKLPAQSLPENEPHVSLSKLYGSALAPDLQGEQGDSWAIARKEGQWVPQVASYQASPLGLNPVKPQLKEVELKLPDSVVSYDKLSASWSDIRRTVSDALDAFSSPNGELVGIVTAKHIIMYPFKEQLIPAPLLSVNLDADETIVMIQWAVDEPFIDIWKKRVSLLLGK